MRIKSSQFQFESGYDTPRPMKYLRKTASEKNIIDVEILKLLDKGVIVRTTNGPGEFISCDKKDTSNRMILNLKQLNEYVTYRHFKMDTIQTALKRIRPGCFMASAVDLKDAYYSISVAEEHRIFIKFY